MKSRINRSSIPKWVYQASNDYIRELQAGLDWRIKLLVALALNDLYGFGQKRCDRVIKALSETVLGYVDETLTDDDRGAEALEKTNAAMEAELLERGIRLNRAELQKRR